MSVELAWAAGFFDGEGSVTVHRKSNRRGERDGRMDLRISIMQCDPRPLQRFLDAVGSVKSVRGPYQRNRGRNERDVYCIEWSGTKAYPVLEKIWPYLSEPKKEQSHRVFDLLDENNERRSNV